MEGQELLKDPNGVKSTNFCHMVPDSKLSAEDRKQFNADNLLVGDAEQNRIIQDNLDTHVVKDENGGYKLSENTIKTIDKYNQKGADGAKFLVKEVKGADGTVNKFLMTSHSIEGKGSFSISLNSLNEDSRKYVLKTGTNTYKGNKL